MFTHFGYAGGFKKILISKNIASLLEYYERGEDMESAYRLHVIDLDKGKKIDRKYIGNSSDIISFRNRLLLYKKNDNYIIRNVLTQNDSIKYNKESFERNFNLFSSGISNISYTIKQINKSNQDVLLINVKNGMIYYFEPFSGKLLENLENEIKLPEELKQYNFSSTEVYPAKDQSKSIISLQVKEGTQNISRIQNSAKKANGEFLFLNGSFKEVSGYIKLVFILSYETTDESDFIITCVNFDGQVQWQQHSKNLANEKYIRNETECDIIFLYRDKLIFNIYGVLCCLNQLNGNLVWTLKL